MQRNARNEKEIERAERRQKADAERRIADLMFVMGDPKGRRFVWDLLEFTGVFSVGWDPSARIHFNAGMRNVGLRAFGELHETCPDLYLLMAKEARDEAKKRQELDALLSEEENTDVND